MADEMGSDGEGGGKESDNMPKRDKPAAGGGLPASNETTPLFNREATDSRPLAEEGKEDGDKDDKKGKKGSGKQGGKGGEEGSASQSLDYGGPSKPPDPPENTPAPKTPPKGPRL